MIRKDRFVTEEDKYRSKLPTVLLAGLVFFALGCASSKVPAKAPAASPVGVGHAVAAAQSGQSVAANSRRGMLLFLQCRACHSVNEADGHLVGPNLSGLFGAVAGKKEDFVYSESATASDIVWSAETLDEFLARPNDFFPGTKMAFAGIESDADREALIAYLRDQT